MPKVALASDPILEFEYFLAKELGMTHNRLLLDMGVGEIAYWSAYYHRDVKRVENSRREAERRAMLKR